MSSLWPIGYYHHKFKQTFLMPKNSNFLRSSYSTWQESTSMSLQRNVWNFVKGEKCFWLSFLSRGNKSLNRRFQFLEKCRINYDVKDTYLYQLANKTVTNRCGGWVMEDGASFTHNNVPTYIQPIFQTHSCFQKCFLRKFCDFLTLSISSSGIFKSASC